jgi:hypothetical protein
VSDDAATEAYGALVQWLRASKLDWVADQIEEEAILGKTETKRIAISDSDGFNATGVSQKPQSAKLQSAEFLVRVDYSPYEKFEIAVAAVRAVVIGAIKIQDELAATLHVGSGEIRFVPGETGTVEHQYRVSDLVAQRAAVEHVDIYLKQLTEDVYK